MSIDEIEKILDEIWHERRASVFSNREEPLYIVMGSYLLLGMVKYDAEKQYIPFNINSAGQFFLFGMKVIEKPPLKNYWALLTEKDLRIEGTE